MAITQRLRDRAATKDTFLEVLNQEILPVLRTVREALNRFLVTPPAAIADSGALAIDWTVVRNYTHLLDADVTSVTFTDPPDAGEYFLLVTQAAAFTVAGWPSNVKWFGGVAPTITATVGRVDLIRFYFDGTSYHGSVLQNAS